MITVYRHDSKEFDALVAVARILNTLCTNGYRFYVDECYQDWDQGIMWTTILAEKGMGSSYQVLYLKEHELITDDICWTRMSQAIDSIITGSNKYSHIAKFR